MEDPGDLHTPEYRVCPKCSSPMILVNNRWFCTKCGTIIPVEKPRKIGRSRKIVVAYNKR